MLMRVSSLMLLLALPVWAPASDAFGAHIPKDTYLSSAFAGNVPGASTLWVTGELRVKVERQLGHKLAALRLRYWLDNGKSVWILDEIGKEQPITIGVTIADNSIEDVRVLAFRESRGWEVKYPFFTDQFVNAKLRPDEHLDKHIDGITGATLSVRAMTRVARVALSLHEHINN